MAKFRYILFLIILILPATAVIEVVGNLESFGLRYVLHVLWILVIFGVLSIVPKPE